MANTETDFSILTPETAKRIVGDYERAVVMRSNLSVAAIQRCLHDGAFLNSRKLEALMIDLNRFGVTFDDGSEALRDRYRALARLATIAHGGG